MSQLYTIASIAVFLAFATASNAEAVQAELRLFSSSGNFELEAWESKDVSTKGRCSVWELRRIDSEGRTVNLNTEKDGLLFPVAVAVGNKGQCAVLESSRLCVFNDAGHKIFEMPILESSAFMKEIEHLYGVSDVDIGEWWKNNLLYFASVGDEKYVVLRTWWGNRRIWSIKDSKEVSGRTPQWIVSLERNLVIDKLKFASQKNNLKVNKCALREIISAAFHAGDIGVDDSIPFLAKIENANFDSLNRTLGSFHSEEANAEITYLGNDLQLAAIMSLRQLGVKPRHSPCTKVFSNTDNGKSLVESAGLERRLVVDQVLKDISRLEVLRLLGSPDIVEGERWFYQIDTDDPFTLSLEFDLGKVSSVSNIRPSLSSSKVWGLRFNVSGSFVMQEMKMIHPEFLEKFRLFVDPMR